MPYGALLHLFDYKLLPKIKQPFLAEKTIIFFFFSIQSHITKIAGESINKA